MLMSLLTVWLLSGFSYSYLLMPVLIWFIFIFSHQGIWNRFSTVFIFIVMLLFGMGIRVDFSLMVAPAVCWSLIRDTRGSNHKYFFPTPILTLVGLALVGAGLVLIFAFDMVRMLFKEISYTLGHNVDVVEFFLNDSSDNLYPLGAVLFNWSPILLPIAFYCLWVFVFKKFRWSIMLAFIGIWMPQILQSELNIYYSFLMLPIWAIIIAVAICDKNKTKLLITTILLCTLVTFTTMAAAVFSVTNWQEVKSIEQHECQKHFVKNMFAKSVRSFIQSNNNSELNKHIRDAVILFKKDLREGDDYVICQISFFEDVISWPMLYYYNRIISPVSTNIKYEGRTHTQNYCDILIVDDNSIQELYSSFPDYRMIYEFDNTLIQIPEKNAPFRRYMLDIICNPEYVTNSRVQIFSRLHTKRPHISSSTATLEIK